MKTEYVWWHGRDLKEFFGKVQELGLNNVRIKFDMKTHDLFILGDEDDMRKGGPKPYNFSHICPPDCGNGG
ncbi:MAG: hypothetical protein KAJ55_00400 [Anaerolineales bacterium]|nr:hypothetical protein [Anaerolineales bacterium]